MKFLSVGIENIKRPFLVKRKFLFFLIAVFMSVLNSLGQRSWIPFQWYGDSINGRYYSKLVMLVPVKLDNLSHNFLMQLDLGAINTMVHGNSIEPYLNEYPELKDKIDTNAIFHGDQVKIPRLKNINLELGDVSIGKVDLGYYIGYGSEIPKDSVHTKTEKLIGTLAPDIFQGKYLIIDYKNNRIRFSDELENK